jgi:hypothetical protein
MKTISTIGVDRTKRVFQVHGVDEEGHIIVKQKAVLTPACGPQHSPRPAGIRLWSFAQPIRPMLTVAAARSMISRARFLMADREIALPLGPAWRCVTATLSEFLDEFYINPERRAAMIADEPPRLADARNNSLLGAIGEHLARPWNLPTVPPWADHPSRFLHDPYFTTPIENLKAMLLAQSPLAFRRRMNFTEGEPLRRARMPREPTP